MSSRSQIERNLNAIKERIASACHRAGRPLDAVQLVAVTKYAQPQWIHDLIACGQQDLGESRPQQLVERKKAIHGDLRWHFIGHLQRNKVEFVVGSVALIHSVDSFRLLQKVEEEAQRRGIKQRVLLEVNISGEAAKDGFDPSELRTHLDNLSRLNAVEVVGLMTMAPQFDDPELARPIFRGLLDFRNELTTLSDGRLNIPQLSMGMSGDFEVAIEEGATIVRIGSSLFQDADQS